MNIDSLFNSRPTSLLNEIGSINPLREKYIFLAGLGGKSGSELLEYLTHYFDSINTEYYSIGVCPFKFEGKKRRKKAISFIHNLQTYPNFKYIDNNLIVEKYEGKINLAKAFEINDKEIVQFISNIAMRNSQDNISSYN
jgi:cell division GTPase FtsZ